MLLGSWLRCVRQDALFFKGANSLGTEFHTDFFTVNNQSLSLEIRLPDLVGLFLRKGHVVTKLLALTGNIANLHRVSVYLLSLLKSTRELLY